MKKCGKPHGALSPARLWLATGAALGAALSLSACQNVQGFSVPSLVRVIDASYLAPALNVYVEKTTLAANIGEGFVSNYGTFTPSLSAPIQVAAATGGPALASSSAILNAGEQHSIFITDNASTPAQYTITLLSDQQIPAPSGQSSFRFLNQAVLAGPVDVYVVPDSATLATSKPMCTAIAVGAICGYVGFAAQKVTLVIAPTGQTTAKYTSSPITLTGGEVRTVVIVDSHLTTDPPVQMVIANDVG